jgi:sirohydrochlorin cobaltochelatase
MFILFAHGSNDARWRAAVEGMIDTLRRDVEHTEIRLAYLSCTPPSLPDVIDDAARAGVTSFRVLPLFLTSEGHVLRDLQPLVDSIRSSHAGIRIDLLPPVGQHPLFRDLLRNIVAQTKR